MSRIRDVLKGARRLEIFLAIVAVSVLLLLGSGGSESGQTSLERRLSKALSRMQGVGRVRVMVTEDHDGHPEGALVIAEGADDLSVCLQIQYAVSTLLDLEAAQIEVACHSK